MADLLGAGMDGLKGMPEALAAVYPAPTCSLASYTWFAAAWASVVAKYADHLPLYRQQGIFGRAGLGLPASALAHWVGACDVQLQPLVEALKEELLAQAVLHADETPVAMLKPGNGKTHRSYLWSYCSTALNPMRTVIFDFAESAGSRHAEQFLGSWRGTLVCDDFSGDKALGRQGATGAGCMAHARRKFHEL